MRAATALMLAFAAPLAGPLRLAEAQTPRRQTSGARMVIPTPPTSVTVTSVAGGAEIQWTAPPGAASYQVRRGADPSTLVDLGAPVQQPPLLDRTTVGGATYLYVVVAQFPGGQTAASAPVSYSAPVTIQSGVTAASRLRRTGTTSPAPATAPFHQIGMRGGTTAQQALRSPPPPGFGRYRVTLSGFSVDRQSNDGGGGDGRGDEVWARVYVRIYERAAKRTLAEGLVESAVHGDTRVEPGRVRAGSASPQGGLQTGDRFPTATPWVKAGGPTPNTFPLALWEGDLQDSGDVVVITPTLWDKDDTYLSFARVWLDRLQYETPGIWPLVEASLRTSSQWLGPRMIALTESGSTALTAMSSRTNVDRPIGGSAQNRDSNGALYWYVPHQGLLFTRELLEKALHPTSTIGGAGPGVIPVVWREESAEGGEYTLYLVVEAVP